MALPGLGRNSVGATSYGEDIPLGQEREDEDGKKKYWSGQNYGWQSYDSYQKLGDEGYFAGRTGNANQTVHETLFGNESAQRLISSGKELVKTGFEAVTTEQSRDNLERYWDGAMGLAGQAVNNSPQLRSLMTTMGLIDQGFTEASKATNIGKPQLELITDLLSSGAGKAKGAGTLMDLIPEKQLQMQLAGAVNGPAVVRNRMEKYTPTTVMKYSDEQLDTLGDLGKNKEFLDSLDPEHRYFTPETLAEAQEPMRKREGPLRTAEAKLQDYKNKVAKAEAEGNQKNIDKYSDKERKLDRKVSDFTAGPIDESVPDNPQTYWSNSADAKAFRAEGGFDAEGNPRVDSHHQTIESMETASIFRRLQVVKENPQASLIIWEHMRRRGMVAGGGKRAQRMVSKPEHTLAKDALHVAVLPKWRGFFKKLPEDIGLSDLLREIDKFAASLDDSDKFYKAKGMPLIDRDIPEGSLMENQVERLIRDVQKD